MRYIITGGCGFLGSNIASGLLAAKQPVTVFDNLSRQGAIANLEWLRGLGDVEFILGDIRDFHAVRAMVADVKPDVIFHFAGQVAMTSSLENPRADFDINASGTLNLLEAVREQHAAAGIIYSSTNKVYGDLTDLRYEERPTRYVAGDYPQGFSESMPLDFHSPYGCSKGAADQYILDYTRMYGLRAAVFRHSSMYGARQFATVDQGWIGWFCQQALAQASGMREPFTVSGNGRQVRDLLHADDMVALYLAAAQNLPAVSGQAFNVGGGMENSLSILELLAFLGQELGIALQYRHIAPRASDQKIFVADIGKISRTLGWHPQVGWQQGIRSMLGWLRGQAAHG